MRVKLVFRMKANQRIKSLLKKMMRKHQTPSKIMMAYKTKTKTAKSSKKAKIRRQV